MASTQYGVLEELALFSLRTAFSATFNCPPILMHEFISTVNFVCNRYLSLCSFLFLLNKNRERRITATKLRVPATISEWLHAFIKSNLKKKKFGKHLSFLG